MDPQPSRKQPGEGSPRPLWISLSRNEPEWGLHLVFRRCPLQPAPRPPLPRDLTGSGSGRREGALGRSGGRERQALPALEVESGGAVIAAQQIPSFFATIAAIVVSGPATSPGLLLGPPALLLPIFALGGSQEGLDLLHMHTQTERAVRGCTDPDPAPFSPCPPGRQRPRTLREGIGGATEPRPSPPRPPRVRQGLSGGRASCIRPSALPCKATGLRGGGVPSPSCSPTASPVRPPRRVPGLTSISPPEVSRS